MKNTMEAPVSHAEKRAELREPFNAFVRLHVTSTTGQEIRASACPGMLTDVSTSGVGLLVPKPLKRGDWFQMESDACGQYFPPAVAVSSPGCMSSTLTCYAVAHCHQVPGGLYSVGARKIDDAKHAKEAPDAVPASKSGRACRKR